VITLLDLMAYDRWANHQYLDVITKLNIEQFTRKVGGSFGSLRDTLVHLAWAEWIWTERWQHRSPKVRATSDQFPTVLSIQTYLEGVEKDQERILGQLKPGAETDRLRYTNLKGEEWEYDFEQMVHHLTMHSAYHRGQLATLLRQMDVAPPTTDYLVYVDAQKRK
jgi:uncharacterized damage-inducible protein DinB